MPEIPETPDVRYPVPVEPPRYTSVPHKSLNRRPISVYGLIDAVFIIAALALTLWFAGLLFRQGLTLDPVRLLFLVLFWAILAYLALPRLHQLFTFLYVPDYFIGRTRTGDGLLGDPVNLGVDGTEEDIHAAMQNAGWILADEITARSAMGIIRSSVTRTSYPNAPVSGLHLFGRRHAFAYQQEVDGNAAQRHHVRFWRVPEGWKLPGGHAVEWLAAGTYDRAVGLSLFTGQVTHKIDANIDLERDYIIDTVRFADPQVEVEVIEEFSTAYHHRNGGGDAVATDGDMPILDLRGSAERHPGFAVPDPEPSSGRDKVLPPMSLMLSCVVTGVLMLVVVVLGAFIWAQPQSQQEMAQDNPDLAAQLPWYFAGAAIGLVLVVLTLARKRLARAGLMLLASVWAISELVTATSEGSHLSIGQVIAVALAVLVVLGLSSDATRDWASRGRREPEIDLDGVQPTLER